MNKRESFGIYLSLFLIFAIVAGFSGCAGTQVQNKESMLSAAGFQTRIPSTQGQWALYNRMTPYKLERNTVKGSALYTYADKQKGLVYVGGDKAINVTGNLHSSTRSLKMRSRQPIAISYLRSRTFWA